MRWFLAVLCILCCAADALAQGGNANISINVVGPPSNNATITSVSLNGGTTGSFTSSGSYVALGPITAICSNGPCAGMTTTLATAGGGCNATNGAGNANFLMTSPDGASVYAGHGTALYAAEGVWTFDSAAYSGVDYYLLLNGSNAAANQGEAVSMQVTNGMLYALNSNGHWYSRRTGGWTDIGTTAPVEAATQTSQTLLAIPNVAAGTYPVCALDTSAAYSNSPVGVALTITSKAGQVGGQGCLTGSICPPGITYTINFDEEFSKNSISNNWRPVTGYPWGNWGYNDSTHGVTFPGDGTMELNGWDASSVPGNPGYPGGVTLLTNFNMAAPGYYEIKAIVGTAWNGEFTIGNYNCPPTVPGEMDFVENTNASTNIIMAWSYGEGTGGACGATTLHHMSYDFTGTHVWGADVSTTRGLTVYQDGVALANIPYAYNGVGLCTNAPVCGKQLVLQAGGSHGVCNPPSSPCNPANNAVPFKLWWFRYYTEVPQ